ncbi:MAG: lasso peptide biosynthesis B2 protein [Actinobacteria bacterium]|nr:lasso peptide biosynthesis B2 protein [Actinomycetota bacterium]
MTRLRSSVDRRVLFEATILLPLVSIALRTVGLARLQRFLERKPSLSVRRSADEARHLTALVDVVARRSPIQYNCLLRSVVLLRVLRRRDLEAELRFGMRKAGPGDIQFHAWVEHEGEVMNDDQHVRVNFIPFGADRKAKWSS